MKLESLVLHNRYKTRTALIWPMTGYRQSGYKVTLTASSRIREATRSTTTTTLKAAPAMARPWVHS